MSNEKNISQKHKINIMMNYHEQLENTEWKKKRESILERDRYKCVVCNKERTKFTGIIRNFGILSYTELLEKGYVFTIPLHHNIPTNIIKVSKDNNEYNVKIIDDNISGLLISELKYSLKKTQGITPFGTTTGYSLIAFNEKDISNESFIDLNIHHKYYIAGRYAWEYDDNVLETLCIDCHEKVHLENEIFVYNQVGDKMYKAENCQRCGGSGYLKEYYYYKNGVCFNCYGEGVVFNDSHTILPSMT